MSRIFTLALAVAVTASAAALPTAIAHNDHDHATGVVKDRMQTMTEMEKRQKAIVWRIRTKDFAAVAGDAHVIHELAGKIVQQFPSGSTQHPTAAKPAVWKDWPDFESKAKAMEVAAEGLMNTNSKDAKAVAAQARALWKTCDNCHEVYRSK